MGGSTNYILMDAPEWKSTTATGVQKTQRPLWDQDQSVARCAICKSSPVYSRAVARLRQRRRPPPLILGQESNNSRMQENTVAVRILRVGQQISPPPFLRSGYGPAYRTSLRRPGWTPSGRRTSLGTVALSAGAVLVPVSRACCAIRRSSSRTSLGPVALSAETVI